MPKGGKKTRFVSVSFDPATQVMVQAGHGYRRQQYSRDVTVGGAFQSHQKRHHRHVNRVYPTVLTAVSTTVLTAVSITVSTTASTAVSIAVSIAILNTIPTTTILATPDTTS
ncbi:hypothetical protein DEU56DRAFT_913231 [Suillus clintonianus]|uniref:uncharacterized protein n=1 Tax=Suillus clintonianus TaxID=1904413 RepID=UPI001B876565|nr:uncharacterized protein DEU56DRAFT_913231 [Suillus clintonianus]KAG2135846.1 hypothetical protein DEU56DRAFT_913231 [Suillus clintonianus]